jgi:hypothetical protein
MARGRVLGRAANQTADGTAEELPIMVLTADTTFYVRTDGNNANTGLANSAGGAWATAQYAADMMGKIDANGYAITVQFADGTYNATVTTADGGGEFNSVFYLRQLPINCKLLTVRGNTGTPANVVFNYTDAGPGWGHLAICYDGYILFEGITFQNTLNQWAPGVCASHAARLRVKNCRFSSAYNSAISVYLGGTVEPETCTFLDLANLIEFWGGGRVQFERDSTFTFSGALASLCTVDLGNAILHFGSNITWSGTPTGNCQISDAQGYLHVVGGGLPSWVKRTNRLSHNPPSHQSVINTRAVAWNPVIYVNPTSGDDLNHGQTASYPKKTIRNAVITALGGDVFYPGNYLTIQVADGTHAISGNTAFANLQDWDLGPGIKGASMTIQGNTTTPSNCTLNCTDAHGFYIRGGIAVWIRGFRITTATAHGYGIFATDCARVFVQNMDFGACAANHIQLTNAAYLQMDSGYTISGGAPIHINIESNSTFSHWGAKTTTLTGTPNFAQQFINAGHHGKGFVGGGAGYSGSATGKRYHVGSYSLIQTGGAGATFFPGNSNGTIDDGLYY